VKFIEQDINDLVEAVLLYGIACGRGDPKDRIVLCRGRAVDLLNLVTIRVGDIRRAVGPDVDQALLDGDGS
jgi:hypothetical protein